MISLQNYSSTGIPRNSINGPLPSEANETPPGMASYSLRGGKYAVFTHKGPASDFPKTMQYIFSEWLPGSEYVLDNREHFEKPPEAYSPIDPNAQEEIWIPIQ